MAAFPACRAAKTQPACEQAGGNGRIGGLAETPMCRCPTGQEECRCRKGSSCLGECYAELPGGGTRCVGVLWGHCAAEVPTYGCECFFSESGGVDPICID